MYQNVVQCRSAPNPNGGKDWVGKLQCGCEFRRVFNKPWFTKSKPAPLRMKCTKHTGAK